MVHFNDNSTLPSEILPKVLYLGSWGHAQNADTLWKLDISYVLSLNNKETITVEEDGVTYMKINVRDASEEVILPLFEQTNQFIGTQITVSTHCNLVDRGRNTNGKCSTGKLWGWYQSQSKCCDCLFDEVTQVYTQTSI